MSITNLGGQHVIFHYKTPATGEEFSQFCRDVLKPGIYSGGVVSHPSGNNLTIAPFYALFNVDSDKIAHIHTSSGITLTIPEGNDVLYMTYSYLAAIENWIDFGFRKSTDSPVTNEITLCQVTWDGPVYTGNVTGVIDTYKTYGDVGVFNRIPTNNSIGLNTLNANTTGAYNNAFGNSALTANTTGTNNSAFGESAGNIQTIYSNTTCLGYNSQVSGDNQVQLGDSATTTYVYGTVQNRSDARDKADVKDCELGLEFINNIKPRQYRWDYREDYYEEIEDENGEIIRQFIEKDGSKKRVRFHNGVIAQEIKQVMDDMNIDFAGYQDHSIAGGLDKLTIGYEEFIAPLIKAIQELSAKVDALETLIQG